MVLVEAQGREVESRRTQQLSNAPQPDRAEPGRAGGQAAAGGDTSASMNQRAYLGTSYLDIAKGAVEIFMKLRARDPASRGDRYMLVTFDEPPYCIKVTDPPPRRPAPPPWPRRGAARRVEVARRGPGRPGGGGSGW
uniref:VWFA domain-containing protein n=1 Tax=Pavo cristatus TaxID=9049 RepID=A0A8C9EKZ5_PAVCR